jgi:site-specific DNA recombinase
LASRWPELSAMRRRVILATLIRHIVVRTDAVTVEVLAARIPGVLGEPAVGLPANSHVGQDEPILTLSVPARLRRAGKEIRMVVDGTDPFASPQNPDPALIKAIVRAYRFHNKLMQGNAARFAALTQGEPMNRTCFARLLRLAYLAPDITEAISTGANLPV